MIPRANVELQTPWKLLLRLMTNAHFFFWLENLRNQEDWNIFRRSMFVEHNHSDVEQASGELDLGIRKVPVDTVSNPHSEWSNWESPMSESFTKHEQGYRKL